MDAPEVMKRGPIPDRKVIEGTMTLKCRLEYAEMRTYQKID
jgi:hypothetical protein